MPLRDHFRPPLDNLAAWEGFHGGWPMVIVQHLGRVLPAGYLAAPHVHVGAEIEVDLAAYDRDEPPPKANGGTGNGGVATAVWAPAQPTLTVDTDLADGDEYEVRIYDARRGRRLVAAVELISPANKDRPEHRRLFVAKCAALLRQRVSVVLVDVVTVRAFNLYAELLGLIGQRDPALGEEPASLYAVSCRWRPGTTGRLEAWYQPLTVGQPLPTLPLWLSEELAVPLALEESYEQTYRDLRLA